MRAERRPDLCILQDVVYFRGHKMIEFDKRITVTVSSTDVDDRGKTRIGNMLMCSRLPPLPEDWNWSRCVQKGDFRGKLPKRIAVYYKKMYDQKLPIDLLVWLGNRVDLHSFDDRTYHLDFTERFNWNGGDFGDDDSCFWGCRELALEALTKNNVFAVRFYRDHGKGFARAWVLRVEGGLVIFNAYGLPSRTIAYVLATLFDYPHRGKIDLSIRGDHDGLIWLNDAAYQIGSEPPTMRFTANFDVPYVLCKCCDSFCSVEDGCYNGEDEFRCNKCN